MAYEHNFFRGAENVSIGHAHMEMHVTHAQLDEEKRLMSILTNQCTLTAQFDSKERFKPPRCAESTRENILKKLREWVDSPAPAPSSPNPNNSTRSTTPTPNNLIASFYWLHGGAGAGKSALAQSLAEQLKEANNLASSFFFFSIDASRNNGDRLLPTLIYQLTRVHSAYEKKVIEQLKRNQDIFNKPRAQQMRVLFNDPMAALHAEGVDAATFPRLIVIDGLDECKDTEAQSDILSIIAQSILGYGGPTGPLPYPFRFLVASRPEGHIDRAFDSNKYIKQIPVQKYDLSKDSDASKDIRTFLQQEFEKLCDTHTIASTLKHKGWPYEKDLVVLIDRSSGHFVYPATVIRYIESTKHRPDDRLEIVLGLIPQGPKDQPFSQLDALYMLILGGVEEANFIHIKRAFSILYLISEKVGYFSIYRSGSSRIIQDMLLLRPGDLDLLFDPLRSLVAQENEEENLHVFHKTLFDFLLEPERSDRFGLGKQLCHESAALYMYNTDILTSWSYAPDFMYFAYHCYLAQPIQDEQLIRFLKNLDILYKANATPTNNPARGYSNTSQVRHQNEKALLSMFTEEGEQAPGAKTIFYVLRMLSLLDPFPGGHNLHDLHCKKIAQFYGRIASKKSGGKGTNGVKAATEPSTASPSMSVDGEDQPDLHTVLDEMIRTKLTSWQPSEEILFAITAANNGSTLTDTRDSLIKHEHAVFASFARAQHLSNCDYRLQSALLPSESASSDSNTVVAHSYHIFSVEYEGDPSLMVLLGTYSRGGPGGVGAVVERPVADSAMGLGRGAGAVYSAQGFDITLLGEKEFEEQVGKFLGDHIAKVEKELAQIIDDQFESKFEF